MLKWFFLFAIGYIAYRYWSRAPAHPLPTKPAPDVERMLECAQCGVRFPESETIRGDDLIFCSEQHRALWKQSH